MARYKKVISSAGRPMYFKDGLQIGASKIPEGVLQALDDGVEVTDTTPSPAIIDDPLENEPETLPEPPDEEEPEPKPEAEPEPQIAVAPEKICLFCGEPGTRQRYLNLQIVYLCEEDYYSRTIGVIASKLRELSNAEAKKEVSKA